MSDTAKLGALIRARREELGASLRATARGVRRSPAWLSRVETGHDTPGEEALERLALLGGVILPKLGATWCGEVTT